MDPTVLLKDVKHLNDYIAATRALLRKRNFKVILNTTTVETLKKICCLEEEYLNKCDEYGAGCIIFEHLLKLPPSKTWSVLAKGLIDTLQYWVDVVRKHLINHSMLWWMFLEKILQFITELCVKDRFTIPDKLVELLCEGLLDLATCPKPDMAQRHVILRCISSISADSSRKIRFALRNKMAGYFKKLAEIMVTSGYLPCQYFALNCLIHWVVPRDVFQLKEAFNRWLSNTSCPPRAQELFLASWTNFYLDARNFLNALNEDHGLVTSVTCRQLTIGTTVIIKDTEKQESWLDLNATGSFTVMLQSSVLHALGVSCYRARETLVIDKDITEAVVLSRVPLGLTLSITLTRPPDIRPLNLDVPYGQHVTIVMSSRMDLQKLDNTLRALFQDIYTLSVDIHSANITQSPSTHNDVARNANSNSEDDTRFSYPVEGNRRKTQKCGVILVNKAEQVESEFARKNRDDLLSECIVNERPNNTNQSVSEFDKCTKYFYKDPNQNIESLPKKSPAVVKPNRRTEPIKSETMKVTKKNTKKAKPANGKNMLAIIEHQNSKTDDQVETVVQTPRKTKAIAILQRKGQRKLYSPKDDVMLERKILINESNNDKGSENIPLSEIIKKKTPTTTATCYKDIEKERNKITLRTRGKVNEMPSLRTVNMNRIFDNLKQNVDINKDIVDGQKKDIYNYTSESEDENFKKNKRVQPSSAVAPKTRARRGAVSSTDNMKEKPDQRKQVTRRVQKRKSAITIEPRVDLADEIMRQATNDLDISYIAYNRPNCEQEEDEPKHEPPQMHPIHDTPKISKKKVTKPNTKSKAKRSEIQLIKQGKGLTKKRNLKKNLDISDTLDITTSPLPRLIIEPMPTAIENASDSMTKMLKKIKNVHQNVDTQDTPAVFVDNESIKKTNTHVTLDVQNVMVKSKRNKVNQESKKTIISEHKSPNVTHDKLIIETMEDSDRCISSDGITGHIYSDEEPPDCETLRERIEPREIIDMNESEKSHFLKLTRDIAGSDSTCDSSVQGNPAIDLIDVERSQAGELEKWLPRDNKTSIKHTHSTKTITKDLTPNNDRKSDFETITPNRSLLSRHAKARETINYKDLSSDEIEQLHCQENKKASKKEKNVNTIISPISSLGVVTNLVKTVTNESNSQSFVSSKCSTVPRLSEIKNKRKLENTPSPLKKILGEDTRSSQRPRRRLERPTRLPMRYRASPGCPSELLDGSRNRSGLNLDRPSRSVRNRRKSCLQLPVEAERPRMLERRYSTSFDSYTDTSAEATQIPMVSAVRSKKSNSHVLNEGPPSKKRKDTVLENSNSTVMDWMRQSHTSERDRIINCLENMKEKLVTQETDRNCKKRTVDLIAKYDIKCKRLHATFKEETGNCEAIKLVNDVNALVMKFVNKYDAKQNRLMEIHSRHVKQFKQDAVVMCRDVCKSHKIMSKQMQQDLEYCKGIVEKNKKD